MSQWSKLIKLPWGLPFIVFAFSVAINMLAGLSVTFRDDVSELDADEHEYFELSSEIMDGSITISPRRTLLFPLLMAALRTMFDNLLFIQSSLAVISSFAPLFLFMIVRKLSASSKIGALAGFAFALWPPQVFLATSIYSETLALPIFLSFLLLLPLGNRNALGIGPHFGAAGILAAGVVLGLATHVRPMYLLFLPFALVPILLEETRLRTAVLRAILFVVAFTAVIAPWSVYMSMRFDRVMVVTANGGETLAGGLNPALLSMETQKITLAKRETWGGPGKWIPYGETSYLSSAEESLPLSELDKILLERTVRWVSNNPADAVYLQVRKVAYMWGIYPFFQNGARQVLLGNIPIILLLALFTSHFVRNLRISFLSLSRLWVVPIFVTSIALISWGSWRFRQPADAALIAMVALMYGNLVLKGFGWKDTNR